MSALERHDPYAPSGIWRGLESAAAALTIVLLALLGLAALAQFWFLERKVHYQ